MGINISPDEAQATMEAMLQELDVSTCYFDDLGILINGNVDEHLRLVDRAL